MREKLQELYSNGTDPIVFEAEVGFRRPGNVRFRGEPSMQKLLLKVKHNGEIVTDHLVLTVGKEIPAVPMTYARIVPGMQIKFYGNVFPYTRRSDKTSDYSIQLVKLLESKQMNHNVLKEAWLNGSISSKQYLDNLNKK